MGDQTESNNNKEYITLEEVKKHQDETSLYLAIENKVYDVTKYFEEHPGGEDVILAHAGTEATESFIDVGHSSDAIELLADYYIGELHPDDRPKTDYSKTNTPTPEPQNPSLSRSGWFLILPLVAALGAALIYRYNVVN